MTIHRAHLKRPRPVTLKRLRRIELQHRRFVALVRGKMRTRA